MWICALGDSSNGGRGACRGRGSRPSRLDWLDQRRPWRRIRRGWLGWEHGIRAWGSVHRELIVGPVGHHRGWWMGVRAHHWGWVHGIALGRGWEGCRGAQGARVDALPREYLVQVLLAEARDLSLDQRLALRQLQLQPLRVSSRSQCLAVSILLVALRPRSRASGASRVFRITLDDHENERYC